MTRSIEVVRQIPAPPEEVYAMFLDSDRLASLPGVSVEVLQAGQKERDDVGLRRRVSFGAGLYLVEEVVALDPGRAFGYRIREARPSFRHDYGLIAFEPHNGGTRVVWSSTFARPAGPLTPIAERIAAAAARAGFGHALKLIEGALAG
jgi:uncharacterized protein YndB with AHSA1/START domain